MEDDAPVAGAIGPGSLDIGSFFYLKKHGPISLDCAAEDA